MEIESAFSTELHQNDKPVYVKQLPKFDGTMTHPSAPIGRLRLNLYGTKPACNIYHDGLDEHLQSNGFTPSPSDPCLYTKRDLTGAMLATATIDNFLIMLATTNHLGTFQQVLESKYKVKNLGPPATYLVWTIHRCDLGQIQASQPTLVAKTLGNAGLSEPNPRPSPLPKIPERHPSFHRQGD